MEEYTICNADSALSYLITVLKCAVVFCIWASVAWPLGSGGDILGMLLSFSMRLIASLALFGLPALAASTDIKVTLSDDVLPTTGSIIGRVRVYFSTVPDGECSSGGEHSSVYH